MGLFKGVIDEIRFYKYVFSFAEILRLCQFIPEKVEFWVTDQE